MNKNLLIIIIVVLALAGGGFFVASQSSQKPVEEATQEDSMQKQESSLPTSSTSYVPYSKEALESTADKRRVLYFYATWCPECKVANEDFLQNSNKIPEDVVVIRVNYNDSDTDSQEKDLAKKYGITYQHTFVQIDGQGKTITKWNGGGIDELLVKIK